MLKRKTHELNKIRVEIVLLKTGTYKFIEGIQIKVCYDCTYFGRIWVLYNCESVVQWQKLARGYLKLVRDSEESLVFWVEYGGHIGFDVRKRCTNLSKLDGTVTSNKIVFCSSEGIRKRKVS